MVGPDDRLNKRTEILCDLTYTWNLKNNKQRMDWWLPGAERVEEWGGVVKPFKLLVVR